MMAAARALGYRTGKRCCMLKRIVAGAAAGALAVGPLTGVLLALKREAIAPPPAPAAPATADTPSPDGATATRTLPLGIPPELPRQMARKAAWGAGWGLLFGIATGIFRPTVVAGLIAGLALGKASQDGWIPPLDPLPESATAEERGELPVMVAYGAFGLALGVAVDRIAG
jgi:hypothetical protein